MEASLSRIARFTEAVFVELRLNDGDKNAVVTSACRNVTLAPGKSLSLEFPRDHALPTSILASPPAKEEWEMAVVSMNPEDSSAYVECIADRLLQIV